MKIQCVNELSTNGLQCSIIISLSLSLSLSQPALEGVSEGGAIQLGLERAEQALDLLTEACSNLGLPMGTELRLVINCAAHRLVDYVSGSRVKGQPREKKRDIMS